METSGEPLHGPEFSGNIPLDSQFRSYMDEIEKVLAATSTKERKTSSDSSISPKELDLERLYSFTIQPDVLNIPKNVPQTPLPIHLGSRVTNSSAPNFLADMITLNHAGERANVTRFLKDFDHLKRQVKELTGQNALLVKDKAFLTGRNEYLETSNKDLSERLTAVSAQATNLQQSKEDLLQKAHLIHEQDRSHYLQSFQKVLKNLDGEKMKELNEAVRKQVQVYQSQIMDLQAVKTELLAERSTMKKELENLQQKLGAAELTIAMNASGQSQNYSEMQLSLMARTHELQQTKIQLGSAEENLQKSLLQLDFLKERNRIISQEYEKRKTKSDAEISRLTAALHSNNRQPDSYKNLSENGIKSQEFKLAKDSEMLRRQEVFDLMSRRIGELEALLREKSSLVDAQTAFGGNEKLTKMAAIIRQQGSDVTSLTADVHKLTTDLRTEKETLERVRKTRDELYDVVSSDARYRNEFANQALSDDLHSSHGIQTRMKYEKEFGRGEDEKEDDMDPSEA